MRTSSDIELTNLSGDIVAVELWAAHFADEGVLILCFFLNSVRGNGYYVRISRIRAFLEHRYVKIELIRHEFLVTLSNYDSDQTNLSDDIVAVELWVAHSAGKNIPILCFFLNSIHCNG